MSSKTLKTYRSKIKEAMQEPFQRKALENFTTSYRLGREKNFSGIDLPRLVQSISDIKDDASNRQMELFEQFREAAEAKGVRVHLARTATEANDLVERIAAENDCQRVVKSKSMTAEEIHLNQHLESAGLEVVETDLGEWIIQLRGEGPSHMVLPAIHLSRNEVSRLFTQVTDRDQGTDIENLVKVARRELRQRFADADMGVTGANFALSESGSLGIVSNEGNARLVSTLPRVHVAIAGLDKLIPGMDQALTILRGLPRNATGQAITSYVSWITGNTECLAREGDNKVTHVIFLDNGRRALAEDPVFSQALRCVRCGACANVCPIYRLVGGHQYGYVYIGAIGLVLTYFMHGRDKDRDLVQNCLNCQACREVCIAGIDLPRLISGVRAAITEQEGRPWINSAASALLTHRKLFHSCLKAARFAQKPMTRKGYLRHMPLALLGDIGDKELPALAGQPFRNRYREEDYVHSLSAPRYRVAVFSGCLQDFVYPEQLVAGLDLLHRENVAVHFPREQGCCGLPLSMLGEPGPAKEVAAHNLSALDPADYDYILVFCASCGSHLKDYPDLLGDQSAIAAKAGQLADKVMDFSSFLEDVLGHQPAKSGSARTAYHAPCHLCRGMGVKEAPRSLLRKADLEYVSNDEEETCCGLGGTYSVKFPEVSREIIDKKLEIWRGHNVEQVVTDCPGCILQMRGTAQNRGESFRVLHTAEVLGEKN
ncbi:MAG: LUD domain-containing protein [Desulfohalobiaceae bacterium]